MRTMTSGEKRTFTQKYKSVESLKRIEKAKKYLKR